MLVRQFTDALIPFYPASGLFDGNMTFGFPCPVPVVVDAKWDAICVGDEGGVRVVTFAGIVVESAHACGTESIRLYFGGVLNA